MNELIRIENGEVKLDSRMIAEHFGKEHKNVLADIRDEIEKLENGGESGELIFQPSSYTSQQNKPLPCYEMTEEGALQLAARYDAVARRKLIIKIKELKDMAHKPACIEDLIIMQAQSIKDVREKVSLLDTKLSDALDVFSAPTNNDWRDEMNEKINGMCIKHNLHYQLFRHELYRELENSARVNLKSRQAKLKKRMKLAGATYKEQQAISLLDIIERDNKLKLIFESIVRKYQAKYIG